MPSKPMILITVLFVATIISAIVGYAIYWSYASVLREIQGEESLYDILSKVTRLEYNVSSPDDGNFTVILENDPQAGQATLKMVNSNGTVVALYEFKYDGNGVTEAKRIYPETGEELIVTPNDMENQLFTPVAFTINQTEAGVQQVSVSPSPSLGPLVLPYVLSKELQIDWATTRSQIAQVRVGFTEIEWEGQKLKGVAVTVEPRLPTPLTEWSRATIIAMMLAKINGIPAVVQASIVAGQDRVEMNLVALEVVTG